MTDFELTVGLEVHVQLAVASKLFAPSEFAFGGAPNTRVSVVELGLPGVLPMLNRRAVDLAIRAGLALEGRIAGTTHFDRKNYFYPDLPKGYQITQFDHPICTGGRVPLGDGRFGALSRIHLEEDAGRSIHADGSVLIDLNRAGVALIEIVGAPDLHSAADAHAFLTELKQILRFAEISSCDMEKGSLRCDANVSVRRRGTEKLGTRVEIKNLNSLRMVRRAIEHEAHRQTRILAEGGQVLAETRGWDEESGRTLLQRRKESADDYRYAPDPDLPPLTLSAATIDAIRQQLPELPLPRRHRLMREYGLSPEDTRTLCAERPLADYFEAVARVCGDPSRAATWVRTEVRHRLREAGLSAADCPVSPGTLAEILAAEDRGTLSPGAARKVFAHVFARPMPIAMAIDELDLRPLEDEAELAAAITAATGEDPAAVADYRAGEDRALHALIGSVMRRTGGRADPKRTRDLLRAHLAAEGGCDGLRPPP